MPDLPSLDEIMKSNPGVDPGELEKGQELLRRLREIGARGARYKLVPPGAGRRVLVGDEVDKDPRTVHLRHRR